MKPINKDMSNKQNMNTLYQIPASNPFPKADHVHQFEEICKECNVNAVNHGEFEEAANQLFDISEKADGVVRCPVLAIQRCRRGGKTFMLHAVASILSKRHCATHHVILISLNSDTRFMAEESTYTAILSRIAYGWERILGYDGVFRAFRRK